MNLMTKITRLTLGMLTLISLLLTASVVAASPEGDPTWETIAQGIEYAEFRLNDPNNVFVVRMDRENPNLTLESTIANGKLAEGRETVSAMYSRYDQALNFWGGRSSPYDWGMRNQAVVAINGSYFDWGSGIPQGGQVQAGWYAKRFDNLGGRTGFAWKLDRSAFIGQCVFHRPDKQLIVYPGTGNSQQVTNINTLRGANQLILYTPQYNTRTGTSDSGVEVVVELTRPTMDLPTPANASGFVRQININKGNSLIPFNSIVLSASGDQADILLANIQVGSEVQVSQEITSYLDDCTTTDPAANWTKTYSSLQGDYYFLQNGNIHDYYDEGAIALNPRTAIAYNNSYIFFIVVDGRDTQHSIGMSIHQLAEFSRNRLGAVYAVSQDGGGSSTLVINGVVVNNTYCNNYSCAWKYAVYVPLVRRAGQAGQSNTTIQKSIIRSPAGLERAVANGMLMVIAQPGLYSTLYSTGDQVITSRNIGLRLGPGTNYAEFASITAGTHGTIATQMNDLDGVLAKSSYWWYVNFAGSYGWVPEDALVKQSLNSPR
jgi:hypothetical protein